MRKLASQLWWKAATTRALRTALVVLVPYIPASYIGNVPYVTIALVGALAVVTSYLTSLVTTLSETDSSPLQPWWYAVLNRVGKTVGQALIAGIGTAVLITDVQWDSLWQMALTAGFGSLVLALITVLPEAEVPVAVPPGDTTVNNVHIDTIKNVETAIATDPTLNESTVSAVAAAVNEASPQNT